MLVHLIASDVSMLWSWQTVQLNLACVRGLIMRCAWGTGVLVLIRLSALFLVWPYHSTVGWYHVNVV
jgi:hypothetical protein